MTQPANTMIYRFLDTNGDGTGEKNAIGDYASTSTNFFIRCPSTASSGVSYYIYRLLIEIEDGMGMEPEEYADLGSALSNGYSIKVLDENLDTLLDVTDGIPIVDNTGFGILCYDVDIENWTNTTNEVVMARLTFEKAGSPLVLLPGHRLNIAFTDNFTGMLEHYFKVQGIESY